jgi:hypothetical protein
MSFLQTLLGLAQHHNQAAAGQASQQARPQVQGAAPPQQQLQVAPQQGISGSHMAYNPANQTISHDPGLQVGYPMYTHYTNPSAYGPQLQMGQNGGFQPNVGFGYEDSPETIVQDPTSFGIENVNGMSLQYPGGRQPQLGVPGAGFRTQGGDNAYHNGLIQRFTRLGQ